MFVSRAKGLAGRKGFGAGIFANVRAVDFAGQSRDERSARSGATGLQRKRLDPVTALKADIGKPVLQGEPLGIAFGLTSEELVVLPFHVGDPALARQFARLAANPDKCACIRYGEEAAIRQQFDGRKPAKALIGRGQGPASGIAHPGRQGRAICAIREWDGFGFYGQFCRPRERFFGWAGLCLEGRRGGERSGLSHTHG